MESKRDSQIKVKQKKPGHCITIWVTSLCFIAPILVIASDNCGCRADKQWLQHPQYGNYKFKQCFVTHGWFKRKDHMHVVHSMPSDCWQSLCRQSKILGHESNTLKGDNSPWIPETIKTLSFPTTRWNGKRLQLNLELMTPPRQLPLDTFSSHFFKITVSLLSLVPEWEAGEKRKLEQLLYNCIVRKTTFMSSAQDSCLYCIFLFQLQEAIQKMKRIRSFIITSNQCLSLITNRHHTKYDLRLFDDGIYYLAHLLAEEKTNWDGRRWFNEL